MDKEQISDCNKTIIVHYLDVTNKSNHAATEYVSCYKNCIPQTDNTIIQYIIPVYKWYTHIEVFRSNQETTTKKLDEYLERCIKYTSQNNESVQKNSKLSQILQKIKHIFL